MYRTQEVKRRESGANILRQKGRHYKILWSDGSYQEAGVAVLFM